MKVLRLIFILAIFSIGIAGIFYSTNELVIKSTWYGKLTEIIVMAVPIFLILLFIYFIGKTIIKTTGRRNNKKPSQGEGLNR
jgi:uncharacterized membrane protein